MSPGSHERRGATCRRDVIDSGGWHPHICAGRAHRGAGPVHYREHTTGLHQSMATEFGDAWTPEPAATWCTRGMGTCTAGSFDVRAPARSLASRHHKTDKMARAAVGRRAPVCTSWHQPRVQHGRSRTGCRARNHCRRARNLRCGCRAQSTRWKRSTLDHLTVRMRSQGGASAASLDGTRFRITVVLCGDCVHRRCSPTPSAWSENWERVAVAASGAWWFLARP
jgi:hypothetical protein